MPRCDVIPFLNEFSGLEIKKRVKVSFAAWDKAETGREIYGSRGV